MQACIKNNTYYDKKANASKLKKAECVYVLLPKADHQWSKIAFCEFRWIGPYNIENVLQNNNFLLRKIGTKKTQMLNCMLLRHFTLQQPLRDLQITPQDWKCDPEVSFKHNDLYARACECDYEKLIYDAEYNNAAPRNPAEIAVRSDSPSEQMWNTPSSSQERSPEIFH